MCVCLCVLHVFCMKVNASYYILYVTLPLYPVINCGPMHVHILLMHCLTLCLHAKVCMCKRVHACMCMKEHFMIHEHC